MQAIFFFAANLSHTVKPTKRQKVKRCATIWNKRQLSLQSIDDVVLKSKIMTIPKTKEECFALLDKELSEADKRYLIEDEDAAMDVHFSLGMWIRNNWIYPLGDEERKNLMQQFAESDDKLGLSMLCYSADMASSTIIESYVEYLKGGE